MKGLVLSGGKGSRLRPFTYSGAKQLVPIANTPVLHFPIRQLVETGITEIGIIVGENEPQIRAAMGDGSTFGARFTYIPQPDPLGLAHAILTGRAFLGDDPFVMYLGDNVLVDGIGWFVDAFKGAGTAGVILKEVDDPRAFGVASVADGRILNVVEKPADPPTHLAVIGIYAFTREVFPVIERQRPSARGELEIADAINGLIAAGHEVRAIETPSYWIDTGKMEDMLDANRVILDRVVSRIDPAATVARTTMSGAVVVEAGAIVEDCDLSGPVVIGRNANVRRSRLGPSLAIGDHCVVEDASIRESIVMEQSSVTHCPGIEFSMLGRFSVARGAPAGARLTLGDHSRFEAHL